MIEALRVRYAGCDFTVTADEVHGNRYWRLSTPGQPDYLGPRAIGDERPEFFTALAAAAWREMRAV